MVCLRIASARLFYNPSSYLMLPSSLKVNILCIANIPQSSPYFSVPRVCG